MSDAVFAVADPASINIKVLVGNTVEVADMAEGLPSEHSYIQCGPSSMKDSRLEEVPVEGKPDNRLVAYNYMHRH